MAALTYLNGKLRHKMVGQYMVGRYKTNSFSIHDLSVSYLPPPSPYRTETLIDTLVRGMKRSSGSERKELLLLTSLACLQFGEDYPDITPLLLSALKPLISDHSVSPPERSMVCTTCNHTITLLSNMYSHQ